MVQLDPVKTDMLFEIFGKKARLGTFAQGGEWLWPPQTIKSWPPCKENQSFGFQDSRTTANICTVDANYQDFVI
jgi:hypothetical protein